MRLSHLCPSCGLDLARERACPEPHYGLPLVRCPRCAACAVRMAHPWRPRVLAVVRGATAIGCMVVQAAALVALVAAVTWACIRVAEAIEVEWWGAGTEAATWPVVRLAVIPLLLGAWLAGPLGHWRRWMAWGTVAGVVLALMSIDTLVLPLIKAAAGLSDDALFVRPDGGRRWLLRAGALTALLLVSFAGIPLGLAARRATVIARRWRGRLVAQVVRRQRRMVA